MPCVCWWWWGWALEAPFVCVRVRVQGVCTAYVERGWQAPWAVLLGARCGVAELAAAAVSPFQGRFEAAIRDYTQAIQLNPGHCRAYYNRAFSHDRLGQFEEAVADYSRALQIEPANATALHNRGSLFERMGRWVSILGVRLAHSWLGQQ